MARYAITVASQVWQISVRRVVAFLCITLVLAPSVSVFGATVFFAGSKFTENGIQWCEEENSRYRLFGEAKWLEQNGYSIEARVCASLYSDPLWQYQGKDRVEKLIQRSAYYAELEIAQSQKEAIDGKIDPTPANSNQGQKIPSWVRSIFIWYGDGKVSDSEVINAITFLIDKGIIKIKTG